MISPDGLIRTVAGTGEYGYSGDEGPATAAQLTEAEGEPVVDYVRSAEVGGTAGVLGLRSCGSDDENHARKQTTQGLVKPPASSMRNTVGRPSRQFDVHSLHRWGQPETTNSSGPAAIGQMPVRPVTLRRHLSVALPLSTSGANYGASPSRDC